MPDIPCKDCRAEVDAYQQFLNSAGNPHDWEGPIGPATVRPAPHPGPRCTTHHRARRKAVKASTAARRDAQVYGLGDGEYDRLYAAQAGRCAICHRATGRTRRLSVDHSHASGRVRGLLCRPCNSMLGHGRDDPEFFLRAYQYLLRPPAQEIGLRAIHVDARQTAIPAPDQPGALKPWPWQNATQAGDALNGE